MKKYEDIINELNYNLPDSWDYGYFCYETAGYYECIKFGHEILWDSENYNHREQDDLLLFVKQQFNSYVNKIKKVMFITPLTDNENAYDVISSIIDDIQDRKGLGNEWEQIDSDTQDEIIKTWVNILERNI